MKTTILSSILILVASQANAQGFYRSVVGNSPQSDTAISSDASEFTYTPLYNRVAGNPQRRPVLTQQTEQLVSGVISTPLYAKVMGNAR